MAHTLNLTNFSAHILRNALLAPDTLKSLKETFAAGVLIATSLDPLPEVPQDNNGKAWGKEEFNTIDLSETQRDACKLAIKTCIERGQFAPSSALNSLLLQLGLIEP